jgi:hypothetical protein
MTFFVLENDTVIHHLLVVRQATLIVLKGLAFVVVVLIVLKDAHIC